MSVGTIQIPVLFDMSGSNVVYGEDATGADFVDSHLQFLLDMTTEANGVSLNASDISSAILVADQDTGDNIFFDGDSKGIGIDNLCNRIAKAITRGKLVHVPSMGDYSNSGIPVGGESHLYSPHGDKMPSGGYTLKYTTSIAPIGDEQMLGQAMARVASVHLIGDPLGSQAFEDATSIQTDLETASSHTFNQGQTNFYNALAVQLSKVLGGSKSSAPVNPGISIGTEKYSSDYNLTSRDQTYNEDGRINGSILPGQVYTSSSVQSTSYPAKYAFDTRYDTHWRSASDKFNKTSGAYEGDQPIAGITGLIQNNNSWNGLWIKVDIGQTVVLYEYKIHPRRNAATVKNTPKEGYLISSIDGINWNEIHHLNLDDTTGRLLYYDSGTFGSADTDLTSLNNREGRYFAFVWKKVFTDSDQSYGGIGELQLLGVTKAEFDGGSPPTPYDVASSNSTLNGQLYSSSHYLDGNWQPHEAFDNQFSDSSAWLTPNASFDKPTGELTSSYTSTSISSGLTGEWIQVDLSQNINPSKFYLSSIQKSRPAEGYLLSSKDGNNWNIVHTLDSNIWNSHSTDRYHYLVDISGSPTDSDDIKIGNHWRLAITKMVPTNDGEIYLYDFNLHGIVFPNDFGSMPAITNEIYIFNRTAYDFTSFNVNDNYIGSGDITNQRYSASSYWNSSYQPKYAFRESMDANWRSSNYLRYHTTTGLHNFSTWTGPYRGEYIQIDLSENFVASSYVVEGDRHTGNQRYNSPKKGYLLGSTDNKRWNLIHTFELSSNDANEFYTPEDGYKSIVNHTDKSFNCIGRYFRFVIEKLFPGCQGYASLYNFKILGVKETEASLGNGQSTTTFVDDYSALASPENLTMHAMGNNTYLIQNAPEPFPQSRFTASSYESNTYHPKAAFSQLSGDTYGWRSKSHYNTSNGIYYGTTLTDIYKGEWVQIDLSSNIFVDSYNLAGNYSTTQTHHNSSPKKGYLLSSLDGKLWRLAHTFDYPGDHADYTNDQSNNRSFINNKITNNENAIGKYWRFVTEKVFPGSQGYVVIMNLSLIGVKHPSQTIQGQITKTTQDNTIYTLDVSPYVLTNYSTTAYAPGSILTGHEYSASSYQSNSYKPETAFRSYHGDYWRSYGQKYNTTSGEYYGPYITNGYKGEWIQVDLSENVFADSYSVSGWFTTTQNQINSSPKKGYLLSSLDGKLWQLAHTFDIAGDNADYTYNTTDGYGIINHKITNNKNAIGRYWRFVIEKLFPNCQNYAAIFQFVIYGGKETELTTGDGASNKQVKLYSTPTTATDFTNGWRIENYTLQEIPMNNMNQTFTASSWYDNNYLPKEAFGSYTTTANRWRSYGTEYNTTSGAYFGSKRTGDYPGEWIQVDLSENYFADNYAISGYLSTTDKEHNSSPKKGYLLSSLDGKNWRLAHTFDISNNNADYVHNANDGWGYVTHDISNNSNAIGRYWRFVTEKVFPVNDGYVAMSKFSINGSKQTDIVEGNVVVDNSRNNVIYKLNATPYDLFNNFSELSGQVYRASTRGTSDSRYDPQDTFDGFQDEYKWYSVAQYNTSSGLYYGTKFTGPYHGEWIQVDLSENVFAGSYVISGYLSTTDSYHNSSPKKGYLLSSLDGKDWRLAHTFDISGNDADYVYNANDGWGYVTHDISNNSNAIGRYWRFVTEKVFPVNLGYVRVGQFTVLGVKYPSEVTVDSGAITTTFANKISTIATPYDLFNNFSELNGQVYSVSSRGSTDSRYDPQDTFDGFQDIYKWYSALQYNTSSGLYYGTKFTGPYHGEWIQVDLSENVFAGSYVISGYLSTTNSYHNSSPKKGYLLSSLDGKDWRLAHTFDISGNDADYVHNANDGWGYVTHDISNNSNAIGRYWRFVTEKVFPVNLGYVRVSQFTVLGVKYPSETIEGQLIIDASNNNPGYTLNATPYDLFNNFSELSGQVYSASSRGTEDSRYDPQDTFDGFQDIYKWYSALQYNTTSGLYYGTKFTGPYHGEWIQVDLSENVFAGSYVISGYLSTTDSYHNSSPKKGYLLSSLDGKDWRLAHTFDISGDHADYVHNANDGWGFSQHDISKNSNAIGRYWRFVTEKVFPVNLGYVRVSQFTVLGVKYPSEVTVSNLAIDPSLNITNTLPADMTSIYDLVSSNSTLTGQVYSGSYLNSTYPPSKAFDGISNNWTSHWRGDSQYNTISGLYYGTKFTGPYPGEWLQVDLSENVIIGEYEIYPPYHSTYYNRAPKKSYLLSSLDGKKWNLVHTHDVNTFNDSYGTYQGNISYKLSGTNCKGRYFRLVTEKVFDGGDYVAITELIIKGVRETETHITSQSIANSYNTFINTTTPYKIYTTVTPGVTQTKTASLGTAANAFDDSISTDWNTSATPSYSIIATAATNEPTFSSLAVNSGKLEVTFSENVAVTGSLETYDFNITDNGAVIYVTPTIANNKLVLEYLTIPASQIYHESFDNEDVTFHADNDIVYVDGIGGGKAMSTIGQSPSGYQWEQKVSAGNLPANIRAVSFHIKTSSVGDSNYLFDNRDGDGNSDNRLLWFKGSKLKFYNATSTNGTASGSGYLATGTMPTIYYNGTLQLYGTNSATEGAPVGDIDLNTLSDGNWHHFYIEYPAGETLPKEFNWLSRYTGSNNLQATIDDLRYYNAPISQANINNLAAGGSGGTPGSFTHTNLDITYTKNATTAQNIVNAAHTTVPVNSFFISNGVEMSRGENGKGDYSGTTSTTLPDSSTYYGEWVQIDIGQTILMTSISLVVPNKDAYSNPKSWKLLISQDNTNWVEALDVSGNTVWDSGLASASTDFTGFQIGENLTNLYLGRYFKVIVNSVIGPSNHVKINEIVIKGVRHTQETQSVVGAHPILYTATESSNTTSQTNSVTTTTHNTDDTTVTTVTETTVDISANTVTKTTTKETITTVVSGVSQPTVTPSNNTTSTTDSTVTTTTHNADDTTITTVTETTVDIATNTVTTTTTKRTVTTLVSGVTLNTATPSSVTTVDSDTTALTTTYNNNDTSVRTVVNKTVDILANTDTTTNLNTIITTTVSGFSISSQSGSSFIPNKVFDASGVAVPALKSIYEQLMNVPGRAQIMLSRDFTSSPMPSAETITGGFPFIPGDKLVMYLRPKIVFAQATFPEQFTTLTGFGGVTFGEPVIDTALASGGAITGQTYTESSKYSNTYAGSKLFDGSTTTFWITASDTYDSDGVATGGSTTIHADDGGGTYTGHYVQVEFTSSVAIEDIKITPRYGGGGGAGEPKEFRILSSNDGTTFRIAYSVAEGDLNDDWRQWSMQKFHLPNLRDASSKGKYWRIAVGKITTGNKVQLAKVELIGNLTSTLISNEVGNAPIHPQAGATEDLASQVFYENFEDQAIVGSQTTATIVSGGRDGTGYALQGDSTQNNIYWWQTTSDSLPNNVLAVSFWHYAVEEGSVDIPQLFRFNSNGSYFGMDLINTNVKYYISTTDNIVKWYVNGVDSDTHPDRSTSGNSVYVETTLNTWHHHYFELNTNPTEIRWMGHTTNDGQRYRGTGKLDDIRYFNAAVTTSQILDLAAGNNGNGGAGGVPWTSSTLTNGYATSGSILDISGLETNITKLSSTFPALFPGNTTGGSAAEATKFGWVGSPNSDTLSLETTDEKDTRTMDLHIWKITITL